MFRDNPENCDLNTNYVAIVLIVASARGIKAGYRSSADSPTATAKGAIGRH